MDKVYDEESGPPADEHDNTEAGGGKTAVPVQEDELDDTDDLDEEDSDESDS